MADPVYIYIYIYIYIYTYIYIYISHVAITLMCIETFHIGITLIYVYIYIYNCHVLITDCRHNDLPWNIRKFVHNQLREFNFNADLRSVVPWSKSAWSHTDLLRLKRGMVGGQVNTGASL